MAKERTIKNGLKLFCANFNKSDNWMESVLPLWTTTLKQYKDQVTYESIVEICQERHQYTPKLGDVVEKIKSKIKQKKITTHNDRRFCDDCRYHSGIRITVAQYYRRDQKNRWVASERVCACTCDDGREAHPTLATFEKRLQLLKEDPRVDLYAYLVTSKNKTIFDFEVRDPVTYSEHIEWLEEREKSGKTISNLQNILNKKRNRGEQ
jgi:hypothetical protein